MKIKEETLNKCIESIKKQCERYYTAVLLTIGIKNFVEENADLKLIFISSEKKMKDPTTNQIVGTPDIVLQYKHVSEGILIELKISAPLTPSIFNYWITDTLEQIQKYDKNLIGWDTSSKKVHDHVIILLVHHGDSKKIRSSLSNAISLSNLEFNHKLSFWDWVLETSQKFGRNDVITVRDLDNGKIGNELGKYTKDHDIIIILEEINTAYDLKKYVFIRRKPDHIFYITDLLYTIIFPVFGFDENDNLLINSEEIMNLAEEYFSSWLPESGQKSQLKRSWVNEALEKLVEIKLAKKIGNKYNVHLPRGNDIKKYLLEKLAKQDILTRRFNEIKLETDEKMITLNDFQN